MDKVSSTESSNKYYHGEGTKFAVCSGPNKDICDSSMKLIAITGNVIGNYTNEDNDSANLKSVIALRNS